MKLPILILTLSLSLALSGCREKTEKQSPKEPSCEAQVSELVDWGTKLEKTGIPQGRDYGDVQLPMADVATDRAMENVTITLNSEAVLVAGEPIVAVRGAIEQSPN